MRLQQLFSRPMLSFTSSCFGYEPLRILSLSAQKFLNMTRPWFVPSPTPSNRTLFSATSLKPVVKPALLSESPESALLLQSCRTYKVKTVLKRRCKGCYFEKRQGRLYVECTLKGRHKQMQQLSKRKLWREDYSKGKIYQAAYWNWRKEIFYRLGDNEYSRFDWLQQKYA